MSLRPLAPVHIVLSHRSMHLQIIAGEPPPAPVAVKAMLDLPPPEPGQHPWLAPA